MIIRFIPSMKHYGVQAMTMPNEELDITAASQLVECIRDGYIPLIDWEQTRCFMYEMRCAHIEKGGRYTHFSITGIIDAIADYYFAVADYMEGDAIMTLYKFLKTGVLEF